MFPNHLTSIPEHNQSNNHVKTKHNPSNNQLKTPEEWKKDQDSSLPASTKRPYDYDSDALSMFGDLSSLPSLRQIITCTDELSNNSNKIRRIEELKTEGNSLFNKFEMLIKEDDEIKTEFELLKKQKEQLEVEKEKVEAEKNQLKLEKEKVEDQLEKETGKVEESKLDKEKVEAEKTLLEQQNEKGGAEYEKLWLEYHELDELKSELDSKLETINDVIGGCMYD